MILLTMYVIIQYNLMTWNLMKAMVLWQTMIAIFLYMVQLGECCADPFVQRTDYQATYCVKCDTTCASCFEDNPASCTECPDDFTFNENTSYCIPPNTPKIHTIQSSYKWPSFTERDTWEDHGSVAQCGTHTLLSGTGNIVKWVHSLQPHFKLRVLVSLWEYSNSVGTKNISIKAKDTNNMSADPFWEQKFQLSDFSSASSNNSRYCTNSRAINIDKTFNGDSTTSITLQFQADSGVGSWGIREFVFIQYLCDLTWCSQCDGDQWDDCFACADQHRTVYEAAGTSGQCECDDSQDYFRHPDIDHCVKPCPSRPSVGQYYGNRATHMCVLTCPLKTGTFFGRQFADDTTSICVDICPRGIQLGAITKPYFHDVTNRKCVTKCPQTEPYKFSGNRSCLASCPDGTYANDELMSCEPTCEKDAHVPMYMDDFLNACVERCEGDDWWADYLTGKCTDTCSDDQFQDNSTIWHRCIDVCPAPEYFGDQFSGKCIDHCYGGKFGDSHPTHADGKLRKCVPQCHGGYFGLLTGNRACVEHCPNGTWGQYTTYTCALTPTDCDSDKFADNLTNLCVGISSCSGFQYSTDLYQACVNMCPDGEYADDSDMHCKSGCTGDFFADPGINKCVQVCYTHDTFADRGSDNKCVEECNASGGYPYRQFLSRQCVDVCPDNPYTFSDPDEGSCVYNCSAGLYKNDLSDPADKRCVDNCEDPYWGDNSTGYGICVRTCPENPPLFGDTVDGFRVCVEVCAEDSFGDQSPGGYRECIGTCPDGWFAQDDEQRRCVPRCKTDTYGHNKVCYQAEDCPPGMVGNPYTNLCTDLCSIEDGLFADPIVDNLCVQLCPINNSIIYFADPTDRWCKDTCPDSPTAPIPLFGNNDTRTCEEKCIDFQSFADFNHPNRFCIEDCIDTATDVFYRNNFTKTCVLSTDCPELPVLYYGDNKTHYCVTECPVFNGSQTWGHNQTQTCVKKCYGNLWGDDSTGVPLCVSLCPSLPMKWSYDPDMLCVTECPYEDGLFGQDFFRTCVGTCPSDPSDSTILTYAYNGTRRCLHICPEGTFGDYDLLVCHYEPQNCSDIGWADDYNNSCTSLCTATPWDTYGDNDTHLCTTRCSIGSYADNYTGTRICVRVCPGSYDGDGVPDAGSYDSFGDNSTQSCVLHCVSPNTWADWQTHRCESRCTGDDPLDVPTYSENRDGRCVIALWCPELPDKLFGDNNTRSCLITCLWNETHIEWADNITRTCIPQCFNYISATLTVDHPFGTIDTRFYGDTSTGSPICVVTCPRTPRLFGENVTNECVQQCPDNQYGDQTGNRSCLPFCPTFDDGNGGYIMWFSQITDHICVLVCEEGTWGNRYDNPARGRGPHCQTVSTDCIPGEFADNSTNLCVPLCPEDQNYFGDPSTRRCVDRCPNLPVAVVNNTASINNPAGILYADYYTRLCVYRCPDDVGPLGTFGDNETNTCVHRCPDGTFGDWQNPFRQCVQKCTNGTYADTLTNTCVEQCPSSPPFFAQDTNWTCVKHCPNGTWADATTRTCVEDCPSSQFRLTDERAQCVDVCPSDPDLYGDPDNDNCVEQCNGSSTNPYANPKTRLCAPSCLPDFYQFNNRCVKYCPLGYFADSLGNCVIPEQCDEDQYAENRTTKCVGTCTGGSFADPNSRYCIAVCPDGWYGQVNVCVEGCQVDGNSYSTITQQCRSSCPNYTYHQNATCKEHCEYGYANDDSGTCDVGCPGGLYADPITMDCVTDCQDHQTNVSLDYFRKSNGFCVNDCSPEFKDFITGNCVERCSDGYWGYTGNHSCLLQCPDGEYGYEDTDERTCYTPTTVPDTDLFGDPESGTYVEVCPTAPKLYFGDDILNQCVLECGRHSDTDYYGDPSTRKCQSSCQNYTFYTADNITHRCELRCTQGTYRFNNSNDPLCREICPVGFADNTTNICVDVCPTWADTFGFFNTTSLERICIYECPQNYYAEPIHRTCSLTCDPPLFAYNGTHECVSHCIDSFADPDNNRCMDFCYSEDYPWADNSTNQCVDECPDQPDYYGDDHVCVFYCTDPDEFADPDSRECVQRCPNITSSYNSYGDPLTGRCVETCSLGYYSNNFTNICVPQCPSTSFGYNQTRQCLGLCPASEDLYGDPFTHLCAYTCSNGYFGSQVSQQCVQKCDGDEDETTSDTNYWGDPLTTMCVETCPIKIYSWGQNDTRTCVTSCIGQRGFADNFTRICREDCQTDTIPETYKDYNTKACVQMCPEGYYMETTTNQCLDQCLVGFADNFSRYCVGFGECPDNPESYGFDEDDTDSLHVGICMYTCLQGKFSDNSTNMCVIKCPDDPDYFGDPHTGRCVKWCTEGSWAEEISRQCVDDCPGGTYEDNLTRRCVDICPESEATYGDSISHACVKDCPDGFYADNSTQKCVNPCPDLTNADGSFKQHTYADNISQFCVVECPEPYFGRNDTNQCVLDCKTGEFGHFVGHICVKVSDPVSDCFQYDNTIYFSDGSTRTCVQKCPLHLWGDLNAKKCRSECPLGYYRNTHNQLCVANCPTDPDQYIDYTAKNCTRKCQNGQYAVIDAADGLRKCVTECASHGLIKDNITNRCVGFYDCPTQPFMFGDNHLHACVHYCSRQGTNMFADNKTQTCVATCPAQWEYFGDLHTWTCVTQCQDYQFADSGTGANRQCRTSCSNDYFADNQTSTCVEHCSQIKPFYYEDTTGIRKCVQVCPDGSFAYNPDQTCVYDDADGDSTCPGDYFGDSLSKQCVLLCPIGTYAHTQSKKCVQFCTGSQFAENQTRTCTTTCPDQYFALDQDPDDHKCVQFCPQGYYAQNTTHKCKTGCTDLLAVPSTRSCENYCPEPYFADQDGHICLQSCQDISKFADIETRKCIKPCLEPLFSNPLNFTCDLLCPQGYFGVTGNRSCQLGCDQGEFADPTTRLCVDECPDYPMLFADDRTNECLPECQAPLYAYTVNRTCLQSCPNVTDADGENLVYLADSFNQKCVLQCTNEEISFADYQNNQCTQFCPEGTYASNYTKECVPQCDNVPNDTFGHPTSHICLQQCPPGMYGDPNTLTCETECDQSLLFADRTRWLCVQYCPDGTYAQTSNYSCTELCDPGTYGDPTTNQCVTDCPQIANLFKYDQQSICVERCPGNYYANLFLRKCVLICDSHSGMYAYALTNQCKLECPVPYRGYDYNHTCILNCPSDYFYNITRNKCTQCPEECTTCTGPFSCLSCDIGYNLFNGVCSYSCLPSNGVITYAHPTTNVCGRTCPNGYFGDNSTYTCQMTCPPKQYGNTTTGLCQDCPSTCSLCNQSTYCSACESDATLAIDNMCYSDCSPTQKYYYGNICYSTCPDGTYVTYTNVDCASCTSLCKTCDGTASNCTSCHDRYYYQNTCVSKCPTGFYGSTTLLCLSCDSSSTDVCNKPLSFQTEVTQQNYQYVVRLKFNQQVSIQQQISDILKIDLNVRRRMLDLAELINNGVSYTYQILSDGTIKLYLNLETDLQNPQFTVRITDPTAIISLETGATLQDTDSSFQIDQVEYYSPQDGQEIGIKKATLFCVIFVLLLYMISFLFTDTVVRVIQLLQVLFFHILTQAPIPAGMFFFLRELRYSLLQFLPNWLKGPIPSDVSIYQNTNQKMIDLFIDHNFLRNMGQILFPTVILLGFFVVFLILSNRRVIEHKIWQKMFQIISVRRFRFSIINDIMGVFYFPILVFGFYQFQNLFSKGYGGFNGFVCLLLVIASILLPFIWAYVWWKKERSEIEERFPFLTNRISKYQEKGPLETSVVYLYLLLCAIWIVAFYAKPVNQMIFLIATNVIFIAYLVIARPYSIHANTIIMVLLSGVFILVQCYTIYFTARDEQLNSEQKTKQSYPMMIVVSVVLMITIIWTVWRTFWQFSQIWKFFSKTDFYKAYGDPDVEEEKEQSEQYNKYEKIAVQVQPTVGDIVVDKIVKECNEKGENVLKVRKKVLKKKKKPRGRGKVIKPEEQERLEEEKQFVRVNQINPFDYDYDEDFKPKQHKDPMIRTFDDDLRDIISDEEEEKKQDNYKTNKHSPSKIKEEVKLKVEDKEKMINDLDDIQKKQEQEEDPFDYLEDDDDDDINTKRSSAINFAPRKTFLDEKKKPREQFDDYYQDQSIKQQSPKQKSPNYSPRDQPQQKSPQYSPRDQSEQQSPNYSPRNQVNAKSPRYSPREETEKSPRYQDKNVEKQKSPRREDLILEEEPYNKKEENNNNNHDDQFDEYESANFGDLLEDEPPQKQQQPVQKVSSPRQLQFKEQKQAPKKPKGIDELLEEQENQSRNKKLMFLFDEQDQEEND